jgi:hypothetical protein
MRWTMTKWERICRRLWISMGYQGVKVLNISDYIDSAYILSTILCYREIGEAERP